MRFLLDLAWRDLKTSGRALWVFFVCLTLGVTLVSASAGLYRLISIGMLADTRVLMGGDLEVDANEPLPQHALGWIQEHGEVSLVIEMDTMLGTEAGDFLRVELQSADELYPLYGKLLLDPAMEPAAVTAFDGEHWGVAIDPVLAERMDISIGDDVYIGSLTMKVRALVLNQPDRNLSADWRGTPVLLAAGALQGSGLIQRGSRVEYEYHIRTNTDAEVWRERFYRAFPNEVWEVQTFHDRSRSLTKRLGQIASGLLIIGFSTLFIGGLGVFNSIQAYLQGKLRTIATLRTLGLRNRRLAGVYLLQVGILSGAASLLGAITGGGFALIGASVVAAQVPVETTLSGLLPSTVIAVLFGLLTAYTFALPAVGRALSVQPASLFRGLDNDAGGTASAAWWSATMACGILIVVLVLLVLPDPWFALGFVSVVGLLLLLLDSIVRGIRRAARALEEHQSLTGRFALRLALANLHRPGNPLRVSLLSLGSALTLLVACTLVVSSLVRTINNTIPEESPALVLYDVSSVQLDEVVAAIEQSPGTDRVDTAPLVRSRITAINGKPLAEIFSQDPKQFRDATQDEYKLSYSGNNIDDITVIAGELWPRDYSGTPNLILEDREAEKLGVGVGDSVTFTIEGRMLEAGIAGIFTQKGIQTRFWFEAILTDGTLDPFINRYVGASYMDDQGAIAAQNRIAAVAPNVISVRTAVLLESARDLLAKASAGLVIVAAVSLAASLLVLISVMATGRARQVYAATVLHTLGARLSVIRNSLHLEYLLMALITSVFATVLGSAIALALLDYRLKLPSNDLIWLGAVTALTVSLLSLGLGARYLLRRLQPGPALLLRSER